MWPFDKRASTRDILEEIAIALHKNNQLNETRNMKLSALQAALEGIEAKLTEAGTEIVAEIQKLRDALGDADIPPAAEAALAAITTKANTLADIVPNAPTP